MFNITQLPYRPAGLAAVDFVVTVQGAVLTINNEAFDFSFMDKGATLPRDAVQTPHLASDVVCDDAGVINLSLLVPISSTPTEAEAFPPVLEGKKFGKVIDIHLPAITLSIAGEEAANG